MDIYNSRLAKLLAIMHGEHLYAITTSKNCCRYSCNEGMVHDSWRRHEECHKKQFATLGWLRFVCSYLWETWKHGYHDNKFEVEARAAERCELSQESRCNRDDAG